MLAYISYYQANRGNVLYGYAPGSVNGRAITVQDSDSGHTFSAPVVNRYPWRLAEHVGDPWRTMYNHRSPSAYPRGGDSAKEAFDKAYKLSLSPTFGINAVFVGGYFSPFYRGFVNQGKTTIPNFGQHVVFNAREVKNASQLIVFADSKMRGGDENGDSDEGLFWVTPPLANGQKWRVENEQIVPVSADSVIGIPEGRYSNRAVVGFFDGSVRLMSPAELLDMRLWYHKAKHADDDPLK